MGRKLDLSGLTEDEAEHVLQVVQRDMRLRKKEEERLSEMKLELDEEGTRCSLLSRQRHFNERCCIRCSSPFSFLLNPKRTCRDCRYNVCKACRAYSKEDKTWTCSACRKTRLLKTGSLEWYYNNVKGRFKRFGSAKVLKTLYRKHLAEHGTLAELTEGSAYEESIGNDDSICGSDSTFYRQSEEHSMAETLTVAMRVAEEAIEEAISKAEFHTDNQGKQNEAQYLQLHRQELTEELAKQIVQNVIQRRRNLSEGKPDLDWPPDQSSEQSAACPLSPSNQPHSSQPPSGQPHSSQPHSSQPHSSQPHSSQPHSNQPHSSQPHSSQPHSSQPHSSQPHSSQPHSSQPHSALKVFRSHSAFSLLDTSPEEPTSEQDPSQGLKKEGGGPAVTNWKSVDRLDNSMLKSPDGNWMALQSTPLSRPSLLTKRKSLVYSVLERESGVVSAYDGMGSDTEAEGAWGAALLEIRRKMNSGTLLSDSEEGINSKSQKSMLSLLKRKVPVENWRTATASPRRRSVIDVNFNPEGPESSGADELEVNRVRRLRKKKRTKKDQASLSSSVPEYSTRLLEALVKKHAGKKESQSSYVSDAVTPDTLTSDGLTSGALTPDPYDPAVGFRETADGSAAKAATMNEELNVKLRQLAGRVRGNQPTEDRLDKGRENRQERHGGQQEVEDGKLRDTDEDMERGQMDEVMEERRGGREGEKEEMMFNLRRLAAQSSVTGFSSTEDELDRVGRSEGDWEGERDEEMTEEHEGERGGHADQLTSKLRELARQVRANQFSSTEDELDRVGLSEEETERGGEEGSEREWDGEKEEMRSKLYRLANQVDATQFSSTEDELDRAGIESEGEEGGEGRGGDSEELLDEGSLWEMEAKKELASKVRDLASLVSASQFSSTEDELDRMGEEEKEQERKDRERLWFMGANMEEEGGRGKREERRDSIGELDVGLFDFDDEDKVKGGERAMDSEVDGDQKERGGLDTRREKQEETHKSHETDKSSTPKGGRLQRAEHGHTDEGRASMKGAPVAKKEADETGDTSEGRPERRRTVSEEGVMEFDRIISSIATALDDTEGETDANAESKRREDMEGRTDEGEAEEDEGNKVGRETESSHVSVEETHDMAVWSEGQRDTVDLSGQNVMDGETVMDGENVWGEKGDDSKEKERVEHESTQETAEQQNTEKRIKEISAMADKDTSQETEDDKTYSVVFKRVEVVEEEEKQDKEKEDKTEEGSDKNLAKREEEETLGESDNKNKWKKTKEREEEVKDNRPTELQDSAPSVQENLLSPEEIQNVSPNDLELEQSLQFISTLLQQRYSAVSLRSITTEVLKVLNATEELLQGMEGSEGGPPAAPQLPPNTDTKKLDEQLGRLEENVYVAAGTVYGLEAELGDLEECARGVSAATSENELAFLEDQVASAAAQVQQSDLQVSDIAARIAALKNAGLNVIPQTRFVKPKTQPQTLDSSRQFRRRLPAPPLKDKET